MKLILNLLFLGALLSGSNQAFGAAASQIEEHVILGDRLTPLWAQEYIGSDLIKEELEELGGEKVSLAVVDLGFEEEHVTLSPGFEDINVPFQRNGNRRMRANHGTSVLNLLTGPSPYRITNHAQLTKLVAAYFSGMYGYFYRQSEEEGSFPRVVSNSLGWSQESKIADTVEKFSKKGTLWFLAAGNNFPEPVDSVEKNSTALLIGYFSPSGLTSYEAQVDPSLLVLAPANEELLTLNGYGLEHTFGASSGATPMVAGTVINMLALYPELTTDNIKKIIKKTAFPSVENKLGYPKLPGLLNGYKAFKVTERLKNHCHGDLSCHEQRLSDSNIFVFAIPEEQGEAINCFNFMKADNKQEEEQLLKELRRLSFLGSKFHQMETACAYRSLGFNKNAEYFDFISSHKLSKGDLESMEDQAKKAHNEAIYQISYYRYGPFYSDDYLKHLDLSPMRPFHKEMLKELTKNHIEGR